MAWKPASWPPAGTLALAGLLRLVAAVGLPAVAIVGPILAIIGTDDPSDADAVLFVAMLLVLFGLWALAWKFELLTPVGKWLLIPVAAMLFMAMFGLQAWVLGMRGVTTTCSVTSVDTHFQITDTDEYGTHGYTESNYGLNCPGGYPRHVSSDGDPELVNGQAVDVVYDSRGSLAPMLANDLWYGSVYIVTVGVVLGVGLPLNVGSVVVAEYRRWRGRGGVASRGDPVRPVSGRGAPGSSSAGR